VRGWPSAETRASVERDEKESESESEREGEGIVREVEGQNPLAVSLGIPSYGNDRG